MKSLDTFLQSQPRSGGTWHSQLRGHSSFAKCTHFAKVNQMLSPGIDWSR